MKLLIENGTKRQSKMSSVLYLTVVIVLFANSIFAQTIDSCPTIQVVGRAGIPEPADPAIFNAKIADPHPKELAFKWSASGGKIIDGQGTPRITVRRAVFAVPVKVTLKIFGLPAHCASTGHADEGYTVDPGPILVAEFTAESMKKYESSIRSSIRRIRRRPNDFLYIIEYRKVSSMQHEVATRIRVVSDLLINKFKYKPNEFKIIAGEADKNYTKVYRIPPGVEWPAP